MFTISFAYFVNIDVLFSLWFFCIIYIIRSGILNQFGFNASGRGTCSAEFAWLQMGAFTILVFWSLWTARHHLKAVVQKAFGRRAPVDESKEIAKIADNCP